MRIYSNLIVYRILQQDKINDYLRLKETELSDVL